MFSSDPFICSIKFWVRDFCFSCPYCSESYFMGFQNVTLNYKCVITKLLNLLYMWMIKFSISSLIGLGPLVALFRNLLLSSVYQRLSLHETYYLVGSINDGTISSYLFEFSLVWCFLLSFFTEKPRFTCIQERCMQNCSTIFLFTLFYISVNRSR